MGGEANAMRSEREDAMVADPPRLSKRSRNDDWKSDTFAASQVFKPQKGAGKRKRKESDKEDGKRARGQSGQKSKPKSTAVKVDEDNEDDEVEDVVGGDDDSDGEDDDGDEDEDLVDEDDGGDGVDSTSTYAQDPASLEVPASLVESEFQQALLFDGFLHLCELNVNGATRAIRGKLAENPKQFVILPESRLLLSTGIKLLL